MSAVAAHSLGLIHTQVTAVMQNHLLKKEREWLDRKLEAICASHALSNAQGNHAFHYRGNVWLGRKSPICRAPTLHRRPKPLAERLRPEMDEWLERQERVAHDERVIYNFMGFVYTELERRNDIFPSCIGWVEQLPYLVPECCHPGLPRHTPRAPMNSTQQQFADEFFATHAHAIQVIKERVLTNLLI